MGTSIKCWDSKLTQAEFSNNHAVNRSTHFSPFQIVYSLVPRAPTDLSTLPDRQRLHGDAETFMEQLVETHVQTKANFEAAVSKYKTAADAHRRRLVIDVGDLVWVVLNRDRMPAHAYDKLKAKKIGPVEVLERINDDAYQLRLLSDITTSDIRNSSTCPDIFRRTSLKIRRRILFTPGDLMQQLLQRKLSFCYFLFT